MKLRELDRPPIIVGGCGRSGTTLLLSILGSYPGILAIPNETRIFCPTAYEDSPDFNAPIDVSRIEDALRRLPVKPTATRWCEKTPKNIYFFDQLIESFEGRVRLLNIVRDGRDVITSRHPKDLTRFHVSPDRWIQEVAISRRLSQNKHVLTVRYEDLILNFSATTKQISEFLEEEYCPDVARWHKDTTVQWQGSWAGGTVRPIFDTSIGRWKEEQGCVPLQQLMSNEDAVSHLRYFRYLDIPSNELRYELLWSRLLS